MIALLSQILYWSVYALVVAAILGIFISLNVSFIKDMWAEFRMGAAIRLARVRAKAFAARIKEYFDHKAIVGTTTLRHRPA